MSSNYAVGVPIGNNSSDMQGYPAPLQAKASWGTTQLASSVINLTDRTTVLEVSAGGGQGIALRWVKTTETAGVSPAASVISSGIGVANFDHFVPSGQTRRFVVPVDPSIVVNTGSVMGSNGQNGLFKRVAWITPAPVSSILATEF